MMFLSRFIEYIDAEMASIARSSGAAEFLTRLKVSRPPLVLLFSLILFSGCGTDKTNGRPVTAIARGIVTYRGEPVNEAVVVFQPGDSNGTAASAVTDQAGKFDLKAFPPDSGAVPGAYSVMVMKISQEDLHQGGKGAKAVGPQHLIPAKYSIPGKSGLTVEVPQAGTEQIVLDLKD